MKLIIALFFILIGLFHIGEVQCFKFIQHFRSFHSSSRTYAHYLADIPNPTGLKVTERNGEFYFLLEHNCKELPSHYKKVYEVIGALSDEMCDDVIKRAEQYAIDHPEVGWTTERHEQYPTTDLPLEVVYGPGSSLHGHIDRYILPQIASFFELQEENLHIAEIFIVKYKYTPTTTGSNKEKTIVNEKRIDVDENTYGMGNTKSQTQTGLAFHVDGCPWSFVLCLNHPEEYSSGGTIFPLINKVYRPKHRGTAIVFSGKNYHGGVPITSGERYIMTGFIHYYNKKDFSHENFMKEYNETYDGYGANCSLKEVHILERNPMNSAPDTHFPLIRIYSSTSGIQPGHPSTSGIQTGHPSTSGIQTGHPSTTGVQPGHPSTSGIQTGDILRGIIISSSDDTSRSYEFHYKRIIQDDNQSNKSFNKYIIDIDDSLQTDTISSLNSYLVKTFHKKVTLKILKKILLESLKNQTIEIIKTKEFNNLYDSHTKAINIIEEKLLNECRLKLLLERIDDDTIKDNNEHYQFIINNRHHLLATENYLDFDDLIEKNLKKFLKQLTQELAIS